MIKENQQIVFDSMTFTGSVADNKYTDTDFCVSTLDTLSRSCNLSIYVIDYSKRNFLYVSSHELFLNGNCVEQVKEMGYDYYQKYLPESDFNLLKKIDKAWLSFFNQADTNDRFKYTISYNFHLLKGKRNVLINHRLTPLRLNESNQIWLALCVVSLAPKGSKNEAVIVNAETSEKYVFNEQTLRWRKIDMHSFSEKEIEILRLSLQGFSNTEIGRIMCLDMNTIKFHKKHIYAKMGVKNISEALTYASINKII